MNLGQLEDMFRNVLDEAILEYGISEPFSWRGSYDEVCFSVQKNVSGKECKKRIEKALTEKFYGYKGGEYQFDRTTLVNFERGNSSWSDGEYTSEMIDEIVGYQSEDKTAKLASMLAGSLK